MAFLIQATHKFSKKITPEDFMDFVDIVKETFWKP